MKQNNKLIGLAATLLLTACTAEEQILSPNPQVVTAGTPLTVMATTKTGSSSYTAFEPKDSIQVYYGYEKLNNIPWYHKGIYTFPEKEGTINSSWISDTTTKNKTIFLQNIKEANHDSKYYFTATSSPEPYTKDSLAYQVEADQTDAKAIKRSDFLIARAVSDDEAWKTDQGLTLHFRHVLSQLVVKVILPKGKSSDGLFDNPKAVKMTAVINNRQTSYEVTYNANKGDSEILDVRIATDTPPTNMTMHHAGVSDTTATGIPTGSAYHKFRAILPAQSMSPNSDGKVGLLTFKIGDKTYTYNPPTVNTVMLAKEKITTIILTFLSGSGQSKLELSKVTINDWQVDKADVGELI